MPPATIAERFKKWYDLHKDEYNARRRRRYKMSSAYRARVFKHYRRAYDRRRKKNKLGYFLDNPKIFWRTQEVRAYYTVSIMLREVGMSYGVFRGLVDNGIIPSATFIHPRGRGWSLYTAAQISAVRTAGIKWGWASEHRHEITEFLLNRWHDDDEDYEESFPEREEADRYCPPKKREAIYKSRDISRISRQSASANSGSETYEPYFERRSREAKGE